MGNLKYFTKPFARKIAWMKCVQDRYFEASKYFQGNNEPFDHKNSCQIDKYMLTVTFCHFQFTCQSLCRYKVNTARETIEFA